MIKCGDLVAKTIYGGAATQIQQNINQSITDTTYTTTELDNNLVLKQINLQHIQN